MQAKDQERKEKKINCSVCTHAEILNKCTDTHFPTLGVH